MKHYMMQIQTTPDGLAWEYRFEIASDEMARKYAQAHTKQFAGVRWFMSLLLWRQDDEDWLPLDEYALVVQRTR